MKIVDAKQIVRETGNLFLNVTLILNFIFRFLWGMKNPYSIIFIQNMLMTFCDDFKLTDLQLTLEIITSESNSSWASWVKTLSNIRIFVINVLHIGHAIYETLDNGHLKVPFIKLHVLLNKIFMKTKGWLFRRLT